MKNTIIKWEKAIKKQNAVKLIEELLALEDQELKKDDPLKLKLGLVTKQHLNSVSQGLLKGSQLL